MLRWCCAERCSPGLNPSPGGIPKTYTEIDGEPGVIYFKLGYKGPIDGILRRNSWAGVQAGLRAYGYTGPIDGLRARTYVMLTVDI